jgi:hypothetical protein
MQLIGRANRKNYIALINYQPLILLRPDVKIRSQTRQRPNPGTEVFFRSVNEPAPGLLGEAHE